MDLWEEKYIRVNEKFMEHKSCIDKNSSRISTLEEFKYGTEVEMRNLIEQIKSLVNAIKWIVTSMLLMLGGFFIWYIQGL